jgi:hypothetical protein
VRLRTLSEAECYARCYGGRGEERVSFVRTVRVEQASPTPAESWSWTLAEDERDRGEQEAA